MCASEGLLWQLLTAEGQQEEQYITRQGLVEAVDAIAIFFIL